MLRTYMWINELALFASAFVFTFTQLQREYFKRRAAIALALYAFCAMVLNGFLIHEQISGGIIVRLLWYLWIVLIIRSCWEVKWVYAFYYAMWSVLLWQLSYELWQIIAEVAGIDAWQPAVGVLLGNLLVYVVCYAVAMFTLAKWMTVSKDKIGPRQLSSGLLIFFCFELIGMTQRRLDIGANDSRWEFLYLAQILIAVILYLQNELFRKSALREELALMNLLHRKEHEQYQMAKENIELINQKCHDLKHQIRIIRKLEQDEIEQYVKEVEQSVHIYEAIAKTGNEVLDTILTEKSLYCASHDITISCVADGVQLGFINTLDLYSFLGNALDNAIEAVEKFEEKEKRQIDVVIFKRQQFVVVNILNPIADNVEFRGGLPVTTKDDKDYHGFGMKSMKHVIKKYDGFLNIKTDDGCFQLEVLFPIPKAT